MSHRFKERDVLELLGAVDGDWHDGLEAFVGVKGDVVELQHDTVYPGELFRITVERIND